MEHMIDHIFLPPKLPQDGEVNTAAKDLAMLDTLDDILCDVSDTTVDLATVIGETSASTMVRVVRAMLQAHTNPASEDGWLEKTTLSEVLSTMSHGGK